MRSFSTAAAGAIFTIVLSLAISSPAEVYGKCFLNAFSPLAVLVGFQQFSLSRHAPSQVPDLFSAVALYTATLAVGIFL